MNILFHVPAFFLLQQFTQPVHHCRLVFHEGMGVAAERDGRVFVPEDLGERLYVHAAFEGAGGEGVPQGMEALVRNMQLF